MDRDKIERNAMLNSATPWWHIALLKDGKVWMRLDEPLNSFITVLHDLPPETQPRPTYWGRVELERYRLGEQARRELRKLLCPGSYASYRPLIPTSSSEGGGFASGRGIASLLAGEVQFHQAVRLVEEAVRGWSNCPIPLR